MPCSTHLTPERYLYAQGQGLPHRPQRVRDRRHFRTETPQSRAEPGRCAPRLDRSHVVLREVLITSLRRKHGVEGDEEVEQNELGVTLEKGTSARGSVSRSSPSSMSWISVRAVPIRTKSTDPHNQVASAKGVGQHREERDGKRHPPADGEQQRDASGEGQSRPYLVREGLLIRRQLVRQDRDEDDVVDLQGRERAEGDPGFGRGGPRRGAGDLP